MFYIILFKNTLSLIIFFFNSTAYGILFFTVCIFWAFTVYIFFYLNYLFSKINSTASV